jgi:bifunctional non-homologous end joining protein LigD
MALARRCAVSDTGAETMADGLQKYWAKRDFGVTAEPKGRPGRTGKVLTFVVQKHAARRLHYDFRLELGGTLKSWAVPKGPSLDPAAKRMAVHVEDHPLDYATFEGVIPPGQYGAGTVIVWDRGTWTPVGDPDAGYRDGKLKFELHGEKLHGRFTLVRMRGAAGERQEPWLLIKERDEHARGADYDVTEALPDSVNKGPIRTTKLPAKGRKQARPARSPAAAASPNRPPAGARRVRLPLALAPQLATLVDAAPTQGEWIYEIKFDGYRVLARIDGNDVRLFTRNGHDWTAKLPHIALAVGDLGVTEGWIDGEIVIAADGGRTDFQALQNAFDSSRTQAIEYYVFDLPYHDGYDLTKVPLIERRDRLRDLMRANRSAQLRFSEGFEADAQSLLSTVCQLRLEGLIGKRCDAPYTSSRSTTWIKLKCTQRQEFVIGGYTDPRGSRSGFGSLLLGVHDPQGRLIYAGNVGTGFNEQTLTRVKQQLAALETDKPPFYDLPKGVKGHWVRPKLIAEVSFAEWTSDGRVRHSVFHGLRADKPPARIVREQPKSPDDAAAANSGRGKRPAAPAQKGAARTGSRGSALAAVKVSNAERVIDVDSGLTKLDLVRYYDDVAERMLPHLKGRPTSLVRGPRGIGGQLFFQKHVDTLRIPGVNELDPAFLPGHPPMFEIATRTALVQAAQFNAIEFHTWNATVKSIDNPDRMLFDLDPGEGVSWKQVIEAALLTRTLLDELGLKSFVKTSGGKGLHVVVPLRSVAPWERVKDFSEAMVVHLARTVPERFVAKSGPKNRVGRIFPDYLRNSRGATTAAAYSARARPGLGVSVPISWDELHDVGSGDHWTIVNVMRRLRSLKTDPWAGYPRTRQTLDTAEKRLAPRRSAA